MIKLDIPKYCQNCKEFEPEITHSPYQVNCDCFGGGSCLYGDTIIECKHRYRCEALYIYLKGELE